MSHKFCLVAMGDYPGTPKITEMIGAAGAGGCIPVIVMPQTAAPHNLGRTLPYLRWLDYCKIAFLVAANRAVANMSSVLRALDQVTPSKAAAKFAALQRLRSAFVTRMGSSFEAPSAPEFVLADACELGRSYRRLLVNATAAKTIDASRDWAGGDHQACML
eukprot:3003795-Prymnesium_polylepis.2